VLSGEPIATLKRELDQITNKTQPESIKLLIPLSKTREHLRTKRILTNEDRNDIQTEILEGRKILAQETVEESEKCNILMACEQFVSLFQAWPDIRKASATTRDTRKQIDLIEQLLNETKDLCASIKTLMDSYVTTADKVSKVEIFKSIEQKNTILRQNYKNCLEQIGKN